MELAFFSSPTQCWCHKRALPFPAACSVLLTLWMAVGDAGAGASLSRAGPGCLGLLPGSVVVNVILP